MSENQTDTQDDPRKVAMLAYLVERQKSALDAQSFRELVDRQCREHRSRVAKRNNLPKDVRDLMALIDEETSPDGEIYGFRE